MFRSYFFWFSSLRMAPKTIFLWILRNSASYFLGFSSVIRCLEQLWLDAPGGLPALKDNKNRAETLYIFDVFLEFYRCSGGSSRSRKSKKTVRKMGAESDRLASTFFGVFLMFFCWFLRVCLETRRKPTKNVDSFCCFASLVSVDYSAL